VPSYSHDHTGQLEGRNVPPPLIDRPPPPNRPIRGGGQIEGGARYPFDRDFGENDCRQSQIREKDPQCSSLSSPKL